MKKLIILVATFIFLPGAVFASACDGKNVKLLNRTPINLEVNSVLTYKSSVIAPIEIGTRISQGSELLAIVNSGKGSFGHAKGDIELFSSDYPGKIIKLHYEYIRIWPFWCITKDPRIDNSPLPFSVVARKDGSTSLFEISGATPGDPESVIHD